MGIDWAKEWKCRIGEQVAVGMTTILPGDNTNRETEDAIYFYTPQFYALDNFSPYTVRVWGVLFPTAEHAFQWKKFETVRPEIAQQILEAQSPDVAKRIAKRFKPDRVPNWSDIKLRVMEEVLRAKYDQHSEVQGVLQKTGSRMIYENAADDDFWGVGADGTGKNALGTLWMQIRGTQL